MLEKIDEKWKDHLHAMDQLRSSIGMVSYAQEDPKVKYKANGYKYFEEMWENIADEISDLLFRVRLVSEQELTHQDHWGITSETSSESQAPQSAGEQSPAEADTGSQLPQRREQPKVSRNAPCPCGSGKKFKKCCGQGA